jgi:hypothetical protein
MSNSRIKKITPGFVIQTYEGVDCVEQEFVAGDQVDWEDAEGEVVPPPDNTIYQPFDMVQPSHRSVPPR